MGIMERVAEILGGLCTLLVILAGFFACGLLGVLCGCAVAYFRGM